jgi:hypothetical protein
MLAALFSPETSHWPFGHELLTSGKRAVQNGTFPTEKHPTVTLHDVCSGKNIPQTQLYTQKQFN